MTANKLNVRRPFGGVAILWSKKLTCEITPILFESRRVRISIGGIKVLLFNVYMPCDNQNGEINLNTFNDVLDCISNICILQDVNQIIVCGDLNTDLRRIASWHTSALNRFLDRESMKPCIHQVLSEVDYTYFGKTNGQRAIIDHFLLTNNLFNANNATPARRRTHATPPVTGGAETAPGLAVDGEHPDADAGRDDLTAGHADTGHANDNGARARGDNSDERARDNGGRAGDNGARARDNGARARDNGARPRDNGGRPRDNSGRARGNGARAHDNGARAHDNGARARDNIRDDSDGAWTRVTRKERKPSSRKRAGVIGCAKELPIRAAKNAMLRYANVFVSRLDPDLSACDLEEYLVGRLNIEVNVETVKAT